MIISIKKLKIKSHSNIIKILIFNLSFIILISTSLVEHVIGPNGPEYIIVGEVLYENGTAVPNATVIYYSDIDGDGIDYTYQMETNENGFFGTFFLNLEEGDIGKEFTLIAQKDNFMGCAHSVANAPETYVDITISEDYSNLSFIGDRFKTNPSTPIKNQAFKIVIGVKNFGNKSTNGLIRVYDSDPDMGQIIFENIVYFDAGKTTDISFDWVIGDGDYQIYITAKDLDTRMESQASMNLTVLPEKSPSIFNNPWVVSCITSFIIATIFFILGIFYERRSNIKGKKNIKMPEITQKTDDYKGETLKEGENTIIEQSQTEEEKETELKQPQENLE